MTVTLNSCSVIDAKSGTAVWQHALKDRKEGDYKGYYAPVVADFDASQPGLEVIIWPVEGNYGGDFHDEAYCFGFADGAHAGKLLWKAVPPTGRIHRR